MNECRPPTVGVRDKSGAREQEVSREITLQTRAENGVWGVGCVRIMRQLDDSFIGTATYTWNSANKMATSNVEFGRVATAEINGAG